MRSILRTSRLRRDERGATLYLSAVIMVALLIVVAFAIDLGQGRFAKRANQSTVDLAAFDAGRILAGNGDNVVLDAEGACEAAVDSAEENLDLTLTAVGTGCSAFPDGDTTLCSAATATINEQFSGTDITLIITYPVPASLISDPRFSGTGAGVNDSADQCERMKVAIERDDDTAFAGVIGVDTVRTTAEAVIQGSPNFQGTGVAALLLLEREGCQALQTSGQGAVIVQSVTVGSDEQPGIIQADSAGSTTFASPLQCTTNTNPSGYAIYGTALPVASGGGPSIVAQATASGQEGVIATFAANVGGRAACCFPAGLSVLPTAGPISSRIPADERFNGSALPSITDRHAAAYTATVTNGGLDLGSVISDCNPLDGTTFDGGGSDLTFNCPAGFNVANGRTVEIEDAPTVKFKGSVNVAGTLLLNDDVDTVLVARPLIGTNARLNVTGLVEMEEISTLWIAGTPTSCTNVNNCAAIKVTGTAGLRINHDPSDLTDCPDGPGSMGTATNWVSIATLGGETQIAGEAVLCQTSLYVGKRAPTYVYLDYVRDSGGINCTTEKPCPLLTTSNSRNRVLVNGGSSNVIWTAPDSDEDPPDAANPFEGLALWTEGTGLQEIKGTGNLVTTGVFFLPNARFEFNGQASAANPFEAQFFGRTMNLSGQGDLNLRPDPKDAVLTPTPGTFSLIR